VRDLSAHDRTPVGHPTPGHGTLSSRVAEVEITEASAGPVRAGASRRGGCPA
jgi:hypothetical protein